MLNSVQIRTVTVDSKCGKLQVWDTAGQDRYKCITSSFYHGAHDIIICFDIMNRDSFDNVDKWLEEVKRHCGNQPPVYLVGTKSDLQSRRVILYLTIKTYTDTKIYHILKQVHKKMKMLKIGLLILHKHWLHILIK
ncbi:unnamed protein product [Rotaria sp. Silwood1]|nr:unnamed protein product [Rotaria sp. Silwood1]